MQTFYRALVLLLFLSCWSLSCWWLCPPVAAANSPRRSVECRVFSKLYSSLHSQVQRLDQVTVAQQFMFKLENDIGALNLEDPTLKQIQQKYVADFHEMALVFKNMREGQLVGDARVIDRMLPYLQTTSQSINASTKELNNYCQKVWGFQPIGGEQ